MGNYTRNLEITKEASRAFTFKAALSASLLFFLTQGFLAYGLYIGGFLRWEKIENQPGQIYSSGSILAVMFCTIFGAMGLGGMVPHFKAVTEACVAGKLAHETMEH